MKHVIRLFAFFLAALYVHAQGLNVSPADPNGSCTTEVWVNQTTGVMWTCQAGTFVKSATPLASGLLTPLSLPPTGTNLVVLSSQPTIINPTISTVTNTGTAFMPTTTGGIPVVIACGTTTTGSGTCADTNTGPTSQIYYGKATLSSNAQTVTLSPGYTSTTSFFCVANDVTTRANPVQAVPASATTFTITNTTGASDNIQWICVGN